MYIPIVLFIAIFFGVLIALAVILKIFRVYEPIQQQDIIDPVISLGSDPKDFIIPSMWQTSSKQYPLDPVQNIPGCVVYPSDAPLPPENEICYLYKFKTNNYYPPKYKFDASYLDGCQTNGLCSKGELQRNCIFPDEAYLMRGARTCNNPAAAESNAGKGCISNTGSFAPNGTTECAYSQCYSPGTNEPLPPCSGQLSFLTMNLLPNYVNTTLQNPASNFLCIQLNYSSGGSGVVLSECNIQKNTFDPLGDCSNNQCQTQIFQIIRYSFNTFGDLVLSNNGPFISIRDRNSGLYLSPVGFNPQSPSTLSLKQIPAGGYKYPNYDSALDSTFVYGVTFSPDFSTLTPGVWWYLSPQNTTLECLDVSNVSCTGVPQLLFVGNIINSVQRTDTFFNNSNLWITSYSLSFWPNYNIVPNANLSNTPRNPTTLTEWDNSSVALYLIPYVIDTYKNTDFPSANPCNTSNCSNPQVDGSYNLNIGFVPIDAYNSFINSQKTA